MRLGIDGVLDQNLPWGLVGIGIGMEGRRERGVLLGSPGPAGRLIASINTVAVSVMLFSEFQ